MEERKQCEYSLNGECIYLENSELKCNGEKAEMDECAVYIGTYSLNEL